MCSRQVCTISFLMTNRSGQVCSMPWKVRWTFVSWGEPTRRRPVLPRPSPPRRPAMRHPDPTRPWYVRVLDSTNEKSKGLHVQHQGMRIACRITDVCPNSLQTMHWRTGFLIPLVECKTRKEGRGRIAPRQDGSPRKQLCLLSTKASQTNCPEHFFGNTNKRIPM